MRTEGQRSLKELTEFLDILEPVSKRISWAFGINHLAASDAVPNLLRPANTCPQPKGSSIPVFLVWGEKPCAW